MIATDESAVTFETTQAPAMLWIEAFPSQQACVSCPKRATNTGLCYRSLKIFHLLFQEQKSRCHNILNDLDGHTHLTTHKTRVTLIPRQPSPLTAFSRLATFTIACLEVCPRYNKSQWKCKKLVTILGKP